MENMIIMVSSIRLHFTRTFFLMYRKDLFEQYGVQVPTTMEEIEEAAASGRDGIYGITLRASAASHDLDMGGFS